MDVPYAVVPAGSLVNARAAASLRPSTSMMSSEGAPRAKEIVSGIPTQGTDQGRMGNGSSPTCIVSTSRPGSASSTSKVWSLARRSSNTSGVSAASVSPTTARWFLNLVTSTSSAFGTLRTAASNAASPAMSANGSASIVIFPLYTVLSVDCDAGGGTGNVTWPDAGVGGAVAGAG